MKRILSVTAICLASTSFAVTNNFTCIENVKSTGTGVIRGLVIEEGTATQKNSKKTVRVQRLGKAILSDHGDGTADEIIVEDSGVMKPNYDYSATSAQWKFAEPFLLEVEGEDRTYVLYVQHQAFSTLSEDFAARLKIESPGGKVKNHTFRCNPI